MTDIQTLNQEQETRILTANEIHFSNLVAKGMNLTQAYKIAFKDKLAQKEYKEQTIRKYAYELSTEINIQTEVVTQQKRLTALAFKAVNRLEEIVTEGKEHNALEASKFVYEQTHGKARQTTEVIGKHVIVSFDLSGGQGGEIPQEILDQLKDE